MKFKKIIAIAMMLGISTISFSNAFSDLSQEHWAYENVETMTQKGVITGYTDGTFRPDNSVTREEFATILTKTLGLDSTEEIVKFEDVSNDRWSKKFIDASSKYLTGYQINGDYYFCPQEMAVREDMAVAVVKAKKLDNQEPDYSVLDRFVDKDTISSGLEKYIAIAVKNGIMNGNSNGTFNPKGALTRAEITALMCNVMEKVAIDDLVNENVVGEIEKLEVLEVLVGDKWISSDDEGRHTVPVKMGESYKLETRINGTKTTEGITFKVETNPFGISINKNGVITATQRDGIANATVSTKNGAIVNLQIWEGLDENFKPIPDEEYEEKLEVLEVLVGDKWISSDDEGRHTVPVKMGESYKLETRINGTKTTEGITFKVETNPFGISINKNGVITVTQRDGVANATVSTKNGEVVNLQIWEGLDENLDPIPDEEYEEKLEVLVGDKWISSDDEGRHTVPVKMGESYKLETRINGTKTTEGITFKVETNPFGISINKNGVITVTQRDGVANATVSTKNGEVVNLQIWEGLDENLDPIPDEEYEEKLEVLVGDKWISSDDEGRHTVPVKMGESYKLETRINGTKTTEGITFKVETNPFGISINKNGVITVTQRDGVANATVSTKNGEVVNLQIWEGLDENFKPIPDEEYEEKLEVLVGDKWISSDDEGRQTVPVKMGESYKIETRVNGTKTTEGITFKVETNPFGISINKNGVITATQRDGIANATVSTKNGAIVNLQIWEGLDENLDPIPDEEYEEKLEVLVGDKWISSDDEGRYTVPVKMGESYKLETRINGTKTTEGITFKVETNPFGISINKNGVITVTQRDGVANATVSTKNGEVVNLQIWEGID